MPDSPPFPQEVLDCWFSLASPGQKDDARVREALGGAYQRAARGELDEWAETPRSRLALILLLDQIPRHLFRDQPETYATDARARDVARLFMEREDWQGFTPLEKFYTLTPWLHAEERELQQRVNPHFHEVAPRIPGLEFMARIADLYLETITRFGRFPHRNEMLGRETTPEEARFIEEEWLPRRRRVIAGEP